MNEISQSEFCSLHLDSYGYHPNDCLLCKEGDRCYVIQLDDGGVVLLHGAHLEKVEED